MIRYFLFLSTILFAVNVRAESSYYLYELSRCEVHLFKDNQLIPVDGRRFKNIILDTKKLKTPGNVAFKVNGHIYVTYESCVMSTDKKLNTNNLQGNEFKKRPSEVSVKEKFNLNQYFAEIDFGSVSISDNGPVASDYNEVFPSTSSTNPTSWGSAEESSYSPGTLVSLGMGMKVAPTRFLALKLRLFNGHKSDALDLTDLNTSISQRGTWAYSDSFKNLYLGYKFIFLDYSAWKPVVGVYAGVSYMKSTLSDGDTTAELSSLGLAALVEVGIEYHLDAHWGLGTNLGYEYLGKRTMKFADESIGTNFKTNLSYSNQYLTVGLKYYFK